MTLVQIYSQRLRIQPNYKLYHLLVERVAKNHRKRFCKRKKGNIAGIQTVRSILDQFKHTIAEQLDGRIKTISNITLYRQYI